MTDLGTWLRARVPRPPGDVEEAVRRRLRETMPRDGRTETLAGRAAELLDSVNAHPEAGRDSAFELLAADALVTYACEAALEEADPEASLAAVMRAVAAP